jgi:hypothetical protein
MCCRFESLDEIAALDRLRLSLPPHATPKARLTAYHLRPGKGDRIYDFIVTGKVVAGCFANYPDDVVRTAYDTAEWCAGAWPWFRRAPGPHVWISRPLAFARFVQRCEFLSAPDIRREPWAIDAWAYRFDDGAHTIRRFAWFDADGVRSSAWEMIQAHCEELARETLQLRVR